MKLIGNRTRRLVRDLIERRFERIETPALLREAAGGGPDFLCIGAQKAGTRWLYDQLQHHPDFWMPPIKELHVFDRNIRRDDIRALRRRIRKDLAGLNLARVEQRQRPIDDGDVQFLRALAFLANKPVDFEHYRRLFIPKGDLISGDITPTYSTLDQAMVGRIGRALSETKVVYFARDPIERFWSWLSDFAPRLNIKPPVSWDMVATALRNSGAGKHNQPTAVVSRWRAAFPGDRFGLYFFDDIRSDSSRVRNAVVAFLGGDPAKGGQGPAVDFNRKAGRARLAMTVEVRQRLAEFFSAELRACAAEFAGPAASWPARYGVSERP
jgi:hypothetical protein